jgi:hypothetical protein
MNFQYQAPTRAAILRQVCDMLGVEEGKLILVDLEELRRDIEHVAIYGRKCSNETIKHFRRRVKERKRILGIEATQEGDD